MEARAAKYGPFLLRKEHNVASWRVLANKEVDQDKLRKLLAKHGAVPLRPNEMTRLRENGGLRSPELCFVTSGPDNLDKLLAKSKLVNDVLPSPQVRCC